MSDSETKELAALGRPFQLGMLYDCRRDMLIPGITLWDAEMLQKDINVRPQPNTDFNIITSDSTEEKAHALNVEASLEASFLGGLVSVKGSAQFLNDKKTSKRQSRITLHYRTTTRFEQLTMDHLGAGNVQHSNIFQEGSATHVVTAVLYGAQAFFVFDREITSSENQQEIQGSLQATIKKIPLISIEGQASLKLSEDEQQQTDKFNCKFHGDFALENNPVSFQDAIKVYSELPRLLGANGEKAVPMRVWLYPLKNLDSAAAQLVRQISVGLVRRSQRILDEMDDVNIQCQDLLKDNIAVQFPEIKAKICKFRDLCSEYKQVFQKYLCKLLPSIRGGGAGKTTLVNVMINYVLGVQWEDRYRFKLIHEQTNRSQAESQTSIVTSYELYNQRGFQVPHSLTIVDTPGFGDTRGMSHDKLITEQVKNFLSDPQGIDHIDAVCFVVQASLARLSANQKYIFDSILSIFDKLMSLIKMSSNCLRRLEEIALKPNTLSTVEYIEILIRTEEEQKKPGFEDRIVDLKKMKEEAKILAKIARGEKLLPEEHRIMKEKNDRLKRITKEIKQVRSVLRDWTGKKT
ncbi:hypothetical protein MATL_G00073820 [Megalops atlanticus]|uniref:SNTX thioredoxin-like domain-containing protein n=1 Tax=Megalops atlanticus TaxID=7932 RepID=A0A9D3QAB1_MEGAT|nr:hypothetical protein MATL_G00073820 [Megalops atlanticus]